LESGHCLESLLPSYVADGSDDLWRWLALRLGVAPFIARRTNYHLPDKSFDFRRISGLRNRLGIDQRDQDDLFAIGQVLQRGHQTTEINRTFHSTLLDWFQ